ELQAAFCRWTHARAVARARRYARVARELRARLGPFALALSRRQRAGVRTRSRTLCRQAHQERLAVSIAAYDRRARGERRISLVARDRIARLRLVGTRDRALLSNDVPRHVAVCEPRVVPPLALHRDGRGNFLPPRRDLRIGFGARASRTRTRRLASVRHRGRRRRSQGRQRRRRACRRRYVSV